MNEDPNPPGNDKAELLLVAGFLGSGKTTLLKKILSWEEDLSRTVLIVNEFGKVGIDGALLKEAGSDVFELSSGCVCCTIKTELAETLKDVCDRFRPKRILVEATGVAQPGSVASVMEEEELKKRLVIRKIVTVLDVRYWMARENFGQFFMHQLEQADLILLNKVDQVDERRIPELLREIHEIVPGSYAVPSIYCEVDPEILWLGEKKRCSGSELLGFYQPVPDPKEAHAHDHCHRDHGDEHRVHDRGEGGFVAFDFRESRPLDETRFKAFLEDLPREVFRIKGPVRFPDRTPLLNFAGGNSQWESWDGDQETRLAFVSWGTIGDELIERLKRCVLPT